MKNDNLNITFSIEDYQIRILKFTYECQTWNTPSHSHSSNSYEIHFIPKGKGTLISRKVLTNYIRIYCIQPVLILNTNSIPIPMIPLMNTVFI